MFLGLVGASTYTEIPRVIAAQQQNTAPEVQQYDADPYQTDSDSATNNGGKMWHLVIIDFRINDGRNNANHNDKENEEKNETQIFVISISLNDFLAGNQIPPHSLNKDRKYKIYKNTDKPHAQFSLSLSLQFAGEWFIRICQHLIYIFFCSQLNSKDEKKIPSPRRRNGINPQCNYNITHLQFLSSCI